VVLTLTLTVSVVALEVHIATSGGLEAIIGPLDNRPGLIGILRVHLVCAFTTALLWLWLVATSLVKFPNPPQPGAFSATHRRVGRLGLLGMTSTGLTAVAVYFSAFVL
jgi:hypothetical protein